MKNTITRLTLFALLSASSFITPTVANAAGGNALTREEQAAITPAKALSMLKQGNQRFV